jgi:hypothetical protein
MLPCVEVHLGLPLSRLSFTRNAEACGQSRYTAGYHDFLDVQDDELGRELSAEGSTVDAAVGGDCGAVRRKADRQYSCGVPGVGRDAGDQPVSQ